MRKHIEHLHRRLREHAKRIFGGKEIPTEIVDDEEIGFNASAVKFPVLSKVKLVRFRKAEDFDTVRTLLNQYDLVLISVSAISNVDELKRGLGRVKLLPSKGIKCLVAGLDSNWIVVMSQNIDYSEA